MENPHLEHCLYRPWAGAPYLDDGFVPPPCTCHPWSHQEADHAIRLLKEMCQVYGWSALRAPHADRWRSMSQFLRDLIRELEHRQKLQEELVTALTLQAMAAPEPNSTVGWCFCDDPNPTNSGHTSHCAAARQVLAKIFKETKK